MIKRLAQITNTLNRNTGYLILVAIIVFGFIGIGFQKGTRAIVKQLQQQNVSRDNNVQKLLNSNDEQTLILCDIIISTNVTLTNEDIIKVEDICKQKIQQAKDNKTILTDRPATAQQSTPNNTNTPSTPDLSNQPSTPPAEQKDDRTTARKVLDAVHGVTQDIPVVKSIL